VISRDDIHVGARFFLRLPGFLRRPVTLDEARKTVECRLERRDEAFLTFMERAVYENLVSPYRALLGSRAPCRSAARPRAPPR
jgi:hypothetical protein